MHIAKGGAFAIQHEFGTGLQKDLAVFKLANTDLGALQIGHDGYLAPCAPGSFTHHGGAVDVVLSCAVAEVQAHHTDLSCYHFFQQINVAGSGTKGGHDLGGMARGWSLHGYFLV